MAWRRGVTDPLGYMLTKSTGHFSTFVAELRLKLQTGAPPTTCRKSKLMKPSCSSALTQGC